VLHYGSAEFGHYFSYIKESDTKWIEFNDERVREFDPHDIEFDCYGGEHWRRESQSAYLLVYEKVDKRPVRLEFSSAEEQNEIISKFGLADSIFTPPEKMEEELQKS
jgi:ubiquitin carboxyl-terminal hydrolase 34